MMRRRGVYLVPVSTQAQDKRHSCLRILEGAENTVTFREFIATVTEEERNFIAGLDYRQDRASHRKALDVAIANGGIVDTTSQGVWFPMEVLELGKNALCKGHEREYALCAGIVLQTGRTGSEVEDMVENHAEDIAALPDPLRTMLQKMIIDRMTGCEQQGGGYSPPAARPSKPTPERWVHHEVTMKRTIKQWCKEHNVGWLGQGTTGSISYDWKLVLGKGRTAIFSSTVKGPLPEQKPVGSREVLIFPNVNSSKNGGKISEFAFLRLIAWVEDCLTGNIRGIQAPNKVPAPSWVCQQIRKRLIRT